MVAAGQQRGARRRADRGRVEGVVADALVAQARSASACAPRRRRCRRRRSRRRRAARSGCSAHPRAAALVRPVACGSESWSRRLGDAGGRCWRKRQHRAVRGTRGIGNRPKNTQRAAIRMIKFVFMAKYVLSWLSCLPPCDGRKGCRIFYFFRYVIFVVPMAPLKAKGAWSK